MKTFTKRILIFVAVMAVVAGAGWFGRKAYKKTMGASLVSGARDYLAKQDYHNASLSLQRALELNPVNLDATDVMADMMAQAGAPDALNWRMRSAKLDPASAPKHLRWAEQAIRANDFTSAKEALDGIDAKSRNTAEYHKIKGAMAWSIHDLAAALQEYQEAARLEPGNLAIQMNLATIGLESTNAAVAQAARISMEHVATNSALHLQALRQLLADAFKHKDTSAVTAYSAAIAKDPEATSNDRIEYLELLRRSNSAEYAPWLASLEAKSQTSAVDAFDLARWKVLTSGPTNALAWIERLPREMQTNMPVPLVATDCLIALKDWKGILSTANKQDWGEANFYRLALQAFAERSLSDNAAAEVTWAKALRLAAHRLDRLTRLAEVTRVWGWQAEKADVLTEVVDEFPRENWAADELTLQLYAEGKTSAMEGLYFKMYSKDPSNAKVKNNLANLYLLRKIEVNKACQLAREAYDTSTNNPFFISTYAYSLLMQDKKSEALSVVNGLKDEYLQIPSVALYYGVVQAQSGRKEAARPALKRAQAANLLPEEKAIAQLAESRM